jgi:hypothetical protein
MMETENKQVFANYSEAEVSFVWTSSWKLGKILFLLTRYLGALGMALMTYSGLSTLYDDRVLTLKLIFPGDSSQFIPLDKCQSFSQATTC